jgi:hypothetical protein
VEEDGRWRATGETRWQTASQERVAAIGTPGESTMKTCGSSEVFGEQVDEEMTLRPPCSVGEACDSQPVETDRTWRLLGADGIRAAAGRPGPGLDQQRRGCHEGDARETEALLMWKLEKSG